MPLILLISSSSSAPTTDSSVDLSSEPSLSSPSDSSAGNHTSPASANSPVDQPPLSTHSLVGSPSVQTWPLSSVPSPHERQAPLAPCHPMITRSKDGTRKPSILYSSKHSLPRALMTQTQTLTSILDPTTFKQASRDGFRLWRMSTPRSFTTILGP